jgi:hypothetical protein
MHLNCATAQLMENTKTLQFGLYPGKHSSDFEWPTVDATVHPIRTRLLREQKADVASRVFRSIPTPAQATRAFPSALSGLDPQ